MDQEQPKSSADAQIAENLKRVFQQRLEEEVPDRFMDLLAQLKQQDSLNDKK